ncbi:MAG: acyl carrier protein [Bacteroidetes bacterium]|nr:acyl carrier protein [Bacteroidota bacterium]
MEKTINDLLPIFRDVLENDEIEVNEQSAAKDVPGWDSLNHIYIVVAIEKKFKVKFKSLQIQSWKCVGDILRDLNALG